VHNKEKDMKEEPTGMEVSIPQPPAQVQQVVGDDIDAVLYAADRIDRYVLAQEKIVSAIMKITNQADWIDEGGKPFLQGSGAEKVARMMGISWSFLGDMERENLDGGHVVFRVKGVFRMGERSIEHEGSRSSKDPFFSRAHKADKRIEDIDMSDVQKSAYTNCVGVGICKILGIRNLTWEQIGRKANNKVDYDGKNESNKNAKVVSDKKLEIFKMLQDLCNAGYNHNGEIHENPQLLLQAITRSGKFTGWESIDRMSEKGADITYDQVKKIHDSMHLDDSAEPDASKPAPTESQNEYNPDTIEVELPSPSVKTGKKKNGDTWIKYGVQIEGIWYSTFAENLQQVINQNIGERVTIEFKENGKLGREILDILPPSSQASDDLPLDA